MKKTKFQTTGLKKLHLAKETVLGFGQSVTVVDTVDQRSCVCPPAGDPPAV